VTLHSARGLQPGSDRADQTITTCIVDEQVSSPTSKFPPATKASEYTFPELPLMLPCNERLPSFRQFHQNQTLNNQGFF
jgi:hypothetical protein